jgi:D-amino-acid oxidase
VKPIVGIIGAGVSGLTCAVTLAEGGYRTTILAAETGPETNSAAAGAIWFPYDAGPTEDLMAWAVKTYQVLAILSGEKHTGVSMIELRTFSRSGETDIPAWAIPLGARRLDPSVTLGEGTDFSAVAPGIFASGYVMNVPLMDTTRYLDYLRERLASAGGSIRGGIFFEKLEEMSREFDLIINCAGVGARTLVPDAGLEPHRGQVVIVPKLDLPHAVVCNDPPLMYALPRSNDCVLGGTNDSSDDRQANPRQTAAILSECQRVLNLPGLPVLATRIGLRPFRRKGVCLCSDQLRDGRRVVHNYGHGGSGFTLSWGCAEEVIRLAGENRHA